MNQVVDYKIVYFCASLQYWERKSRRITSCKRALCNLGTMRFKLGWIKKRLIIHLRMNV